MSGNILTSTLKLLLEDNVTKPARTVAMALKQVEANVKAVAAGMGGASVAASDKFVASLAKLKLSAKDIQAVSAAWKSYSASAALAADASQWTKTQAAGVRAWESQTIAALRAVEREQANYARSTRAAVMAAQTQGPGVMRRFAGNVAGGVGGMMAGMGAMVVGKDAVKAGATLQAEQIKLIAAGIKGAELDAAQTQAIKLAAQSPGVSIAALEEAYRGARAVANPASLPAMMPAIAQAMSAMNAIDPSGESAGKIQEALKAAEIVGATRSPQRLAAYFDAMVRAQQVMGKDVSPDAVLAVARSLKASGATVSDRFLNTTALMLGEEMGPKMGRAVDSLQKALAEPTGEKAKEMVRLGIFSRRDFTGGKRGSLGRLKPGAKPQGGELAGTDPDLWVWRYLQADFKKVGLTKLEDKIAETRLLFPAFATDLVAKLIEQEDELKGKAAEFEAAQGIDSAKLNMENAAFALGALKTSLSDFGAVLTSPMMKTAAGAMSGLTHWIGDLTTIYHDWAKVNEAAAGLVGGGASVAALAGGGGLAYGMFSSLMSGFGLKGSAIALDSSAAALTAAATRLGAGGAAGAAGAGGAGGAAGAAGAGAAGGAAEGVAITAAAAARDAVKIGAAAAIPAAILSAEAGMSPEAKALEDADRRAILDWMSGVPGLATVADAIRRFNREPTISDAALIAAARRENDLQRPPMGPPSPFAPPQPLKEALTYAPGAPGEMNWGGGARNPLAPAEAAADDAKASLEQLNATVKPVVDLSSLAAAEEMVDRLLGGLSRVGALAADAAGTIGSARVSALGATQRGNFTFGGVSGE